MNDRPARYAALLEHARNTAEPMPQWLGDEALTLEEGFAAQAAGAALRVQGGDAWVGMKLGFTHAAMLARRGLKDPVPGYLLRSMALPDGAELDARALIRPRAEPEVAFRMAGPVAPDATEADLQAAIDAVAPAIEIVDSRYRDFQFTLPDVVADNVSGCAFLTGRWQAPALELGGLRVEVWLDGERVAQGSTDAILGHPLTALRAALRLAAASGRPLPAGAIVMAGAATDPLELPKAGQLQVRIDGLGQAGCSLRNA